MTGPWQRFPDVQQVLVTLLEPFAGTGHTGSETPANLADVLPFIRVVRIGGPSDRLNDYARVRVDVFAATYAAAEPLAQRVHQYMTGTGLRSGLAVIDRVGVDQVPIEQPWGPGIRRFEAGYLIVSRRYTAAS